MDWSDIHGWFDYASLYFEQVRRARDGARFVEVGSWLGRSAAYMGQKIKESGKRIRLHAVDNFVGSSDDPGNGEVCRASNLSGSFADQFAENMRRCGVDDCVEQIVGDSAASAERFEDASLDFVFIDADHSERAVYADLKAWWPKVRSGGLLAGHDFDEPAVNAAANGFASEIGCAIYGDGAASQDGYKCFGIPKAPTEESTIFLALPNYDGNANARAIMTACVTAYSGPGRVIIPETPSSLLASNFNGLWCMALNHPEVTHFAMLHADIVPMRWWLDVLMHELNATGSHMVSTVVPIKDNFGVTSTGIANPKFRWAPLRRFTMKEIMTMPATFDATQARHDGYNLVLNTGCWMCDLRDPRWRELDENGELKAYFTINDRITKVGNDFIPWCQPEDFFFSNRIQDMGLKAIATRKVQVDHMGPFKFANSSPWGLWQSDEATRGVWSQLQEVEATVSVE